MGPGDVARRHKQLQRRVWCACLLSMTHGPGLELDAGAGVASACRLGANVEYAAKVNWQPVL